MDKTHVIYESFSPYKLNASGCAFFVKAVEKHIIDVWMRDAEYPYLEPLKEVIIPGESGRPLMPLQYCNFCGERVVLSKTIDI